MQKARHHTKKGALTACRRTVSGTVSLPCSGCFSPFPHGTCSLSVSGEYLALADGPAGFTQGSTCPALLRYHARVHKGFGYGAVTRCGRTFQNVPLAFMSRFAAWPYYPGAALPHAPVWALPRSLAATGGITVVFSSCGY